MTGNVMRELRKGDVRKIFLDSKARVYKCSYCALVVGSRTVERHLANHARDVKGQFTCKYCCYTLNPRSVHEIRHRKYLDTTHKFRCEECRFAGDSQIALDSHLSLNLHKEQQFGQPSATDRERKYSMPLTIANSASTDRSTRNKFMFKVKNAYRCSFCGMSTPRFGKSIMHIQRHQIKSDDDLTCKYCSFSSSYIGHHQIQHKKFLLEEHKFRCDSCNFAGDTQLAMDAHLLLGLHGKNGGESSMASHQGTKTTLTKQHTAMGRNNAGKYKKMLDHKGGKFITTKKTEMRNNDTRKIGKYLMARKKFIFKINQCDRCAYCGMTSRFDTISTHLQRHRRKKRGDLTCQYCSFSCSKYILRNHQSRHKKFILVEHKFRCEYCNFAGDTQFAMNAHLHLGVHGEKGGESSMDWQKGQELEQEEEEDSDTGDRLRRGSTPAISGDVVQFRRVKGLKMARKIGEGKNYPTLCLLCGMSVSHGLSYMQKHERHHYRTSNTDNLKKCDYCSYVSSGPHNKHHQNFQSKHHEFVCDMCNFVCDYKSLLHLHQETTRHEGESNDSCRSPNPIETSDCDDDEVAVSPPEDTEVCSDTISSNTVGSNSVEVKQDCPRSSTSNLERLVSGGATESLQQSSLNDDDIEIISVVPAKRELPIQRQRDIFRCPFCPFLVNVAQVMMTHLYSHTEFTSGQPAHQQPAQPLSVPSSFGATAHPQLLHPQPLLQPSQFVPQQTPYWQPHTSGMVPQQMMNQVAYPQASLVTQHLNHL